MTNETKKLKFVLSITRRQILDSSKLKEFADDNFKFDENGRKLSIRVENTMGKVELYSLTFCQFVEICIVSCRSQFLLIIILNAVSFDIASLVLFSLY